MKHTRTTLNFGLARKLQEDLDATQVLAHIEKFVGHIETYGRAHSHTEDTLIIVVNVVGDVHKVIDQLSEHFEQDAIAYVIAGKGYMAGPKAYDWGPFDPSYFMNLAGEFQTAESVLAIV